MCLAQGPQRSDASEARTCGLSVSSQALYHWATALLFVLYMYLRSAKAQTKIKYLQSNLINSKSYVQGVYF